MKAPVLKVRGLSVTFRQYAKGLHQTDLNTIKDLSLHVDGGEMVAVIGASGSGKSLLAQSILGILPYNATSGGEILYQGEPLTKRRAEQLRGSEIFLVPQSVSYLDPLMKVGAQLGRGKKSSEAAATQVLARYGLEEGVKNLYPFELSGGMARRVLISTAVMAQPRLVIADEPTPGLHAEVARMVLSHFREMADGGSAVLLITHDLELALEFADRIVVFYAGVTIEEAKAADFADPSKLRHPYTRALWQAMPANGFKAIPGSQPYVKQAADGCPFAARCPDAGDGCGEPIPYRECGGGLVRCLRAEGV